MRKQRAAGRSAPVSGFLLFCLKLSDNVCAAVAVSENDMVPCWIFGMVTVAVAECLDNENNSAPQIESTVSVCFNLCISILPQILNAALYQHVGNMPLKYIKNFY